jgi:glycogen debranching enzyme/glycosidase
MTPAPGDRLQRYVGDHLRFVLKDRTGRGLAKGWSARVRTNLGRAERLRREIIQAHTKGLPPAGASWRDLPMKADAGGWSLELPLAEVGYFKAKAFLLDPQGWQHWPEGPDVGIAVHPNAYRTGNSIYCAFPRLFGGTKAASSTQNQKIESQILQVEEHGYTMLPPSGKLRDLIQHLPHIIDVLGCRVLHLLPVNPTPTTYARFGRFGSPYAALDLTAIDPALVVFDKRTTGIDQFRELTYATHLRGGRVFLDLVINHTGWSSVLQETHPEWFLRNPDGTFASPGAWGTTWEDLVELKHDNVGLWDKLAEMFLAWCRRGVDGFRCDAGYKVPVRAWQYIVARVQQEYPDSLFLLEGLGGAWETTEALLTEGGMQWAYSELFQNYSGLQVANYLDHCLKQIDRAGLLVHYSETHDNDRLAERGRAWSLLRNRLCALTSVSGGFGFTCGVEWLATEKIKVHGSTDLAWGNKDNLIAELAQLNRLLTGHPCFFDGAKLTRFGPADSSVCALLRESAEGKDHVLVLINNDVEKEGTLVLAGKRLREIDTLTFDLLGQPLPDIKVSKAGEVSITLPPGGAYCLSPTAQPRGLSGDTYRRARAQAAWAVQVLGEDLSVREIGGFDWRALAEIVDRSPFAFLAAIRQLDPGTTSELQAALDAAVRQNSFPNVVRWGLMDCRRVTPVPAGHWLLIEDVAPFRASLEVRGEKGEGRGVEHVESIAAGKGHVASFSPRNVVADAEVALERYEASSPHVTAPIRFLAAEPTGSSRNLALHNSHLVLLTNGIGGMARICVDLGRVHSKYDCVLGANLHPRLPVDRHIFAKRIRVWVNAEGFISALDLKNLVSFEPGPPAVWQFVANAGDGRTIEIELWANMIPGRNTTLFQFSRPTAAQATGRQLPEGADVRLTVRVDIEDRNFHWETRRNAGADVHFSTHIHTLGTGDFAPRTSPLSPHTGFAFTPAADRQLRVFANAGQYHPQPEWSENLPHPLELSRGQVESGDAYSPGWFDLPLTKGANTTLVVTADTTDPSAEQLQFSNLQSQISNPPDSFARQLHRSMRAFVVRRDSGRTVIAGYPWFLDWGRDTLICARGLLAAGMGDEVKEILLTFARFEKNGTLPNTIRGEDASNRDTSDAPLWFGIACEELAKATRGNPGSMRDTGEQEGIRHPAPDVPHPSDFYCTPVDRSGRAIRDVLQSIATHYAKGTPNGIRMDPVSALIWSPSHFTWMDTNYPAGTPREGYPVEIQALWIQLLRQLANICEENERPHWSKLADRALTSLEELFWLEERGWYADLLVAQPGQAAAQAAASDALRSNCLFPVSLGLAQGERAKRCVEAARRYLVVPGALRSLAPLPVSMPLPVCGNDGRLLNNPKEPYWGRYEGDEDTRRKPAYHNGTAWTWTLPIFCEALARAWDFVPEATAAARAYLGSMDQLMQQGCLGQIPEILDGDAPHTPRGCDAQAWSVTEALRVWKLLNSPQPEHGGDG